MDGLTTVEQIQYDELTTQQKRFYCRCRTNGQSHNMGIVLASRQAPGSNRADERVLARGVNGKYQSGLARYPGDPQAYVTSVTGPHSDFARKLDEQGKVLVGDGPRGVKSEAMPEASSYEPPPFTREDMQGLTAAATQMKEWAKTR